VAIDAFLKYGPTGLAGLMLVLVIISLKADVTPSRERILRQFMYIGAGCFALALAASFFSITREYPLHFRVEPLEEGDPATRELPPPIVIINNVPVKTMTYTVKSEVTAVVDVADAIKFVTNVKTQLASQTKRESARSAVTGVITQIQGLMMSMGQGCSGAAYGVPPGNWGALQGHGNAAVDAFQNAIVALAKGDFANAVQQINAGQASLNNLVNGAHDSCPGGDHGVDPVSYGAYQFTRATLYATLDGLKPLLQ
jgi:hypothetical protein